MAASSPAPAQYDVAIVGAGVVGSALAYSLARSGRTVALFERDLSVPDRIVGELLQPGGVRALKKLGLEDCLDGIDAVPVEGYQVFYGPRSVPIPYPTQTAPEAHKGVHSFSGKVEGRSFHHGSFVQALRTRAINQKGVTTFEATVKDVITEQDKVVGVSAVRKLTASAPDSEAPATQTTDETLNIRAAVTIIADGCFSKFRRTHGSSIAPTVRSNFVALELNHAPMPAPRHGHVVLSPSGPILVYQISTEHTRILIDVAGEKLPSAAKGDLQRHIADSVIPSLPQQLQPCVREELNKGQRLRSMPNSFLPPSMQGQAQAGVIVVGDAMNMRHPLTGGGMTVGLWDCVHLAQLLGGNAWRPEVDDGNVAASAASAASSHTPIDLANWPSIRSALRNWHWQRKGLSSVINILAQALYSLFGADDENLEVLREGCFRYFEMGGECVAGPVSLLSGLAPSPMLLVYHFFSVAIYSIYSLFVHERAYPGEDRPRAPRLTEWPALVIRSILVFWTACVVILPVIWTEMKSNVPSFKAAKDAAASASSKSTRAGSGPSTRSLCLAVLAVSVAYMYMASDAAQSTSGSPPSASSHLATGLKYFGVLPKAFASPIQE